MTYRGTGSNATIGHGMNAVPKMYWIKRSSHQENWKVYHESLGATKFINLNDAGQAEHKVIFLMTQVNLISILHWH